MPSSIPLLKLPGALQKLWYHSKAKILQKLLWGSGGDHPPRRRFGGRASKVFLLTLILTLILILLPPKGDLGAQPQGFDFVFLPAGYHVPGSTFMP